jgi:hypothetical protein
VTTPAEILLSQHLRGIAEGLDAALQKLCGERMGFVLIVRPFQQTDAHAQYVSNVERPHSIDLIQALLERWQQQAPDIPHHLRN